MNASLLSNAETSTEQTLKDFLAKPYRVQSGSFASTDTNATFSFFNLFDSLTDLEPYLSKLKGYFGIRADIHIRLQVNANKFQAGRYMLVFVPTGGVGTTTNDIITNVRFANLTTITQLPRVEIDINCQSEASMIIPYTALMSHIPAQPGTTTELGIYGYTKIIPYSPLVSVAGSTTATYDVYMSMHNVHLAGACVPQSSKFVPKAKPTSEREQIRAGVGPIEAITGVAGAITNVVGERIPSLSLLTEPASWALSLMETTAKAFGWSNPINLEPVHRNMLQPYGYINNPDAVDNCLPLSLHSDNSVEILPGFAGTDVDEMSLDFIKSKPAYLATFSWTTSDAIDTVLYNLPLKMDDFYTSFTSGTYTPKCYPPFVYIAQMFRYWRGGLRFTFKFVKTEFHSGRIGIMFNPIVLGGSAPAYTTANRTYALREIIDIRDGNTIDIIIPYVSLTPFLDKETLFGTLQLYVTNPLIAPATVSSTIKVLVEISAAPDFEYAVPAPTLIRPTAVYNPQASKFVPKKDKDYLYSGIIGNSQLLSDDHMSARACIGEKIMSVSSLLKRADKASSTTPSAGQIYYFFDPAAISFVYTTAGAPAIPATAPDMYDIICSMFLYTRGGHRIRVTQNKVSTTPIVECVLTNSALDYSGPYTSNAIVAGNNDHPNRVVHTTLLGDQLQVQIPQYTPFHSRSINAEWYSNPQPKVYRKLASRNKLQFSLVSDSEQVYVWRSVADDFQCGYFLGCPPVS